MTSESFISMRKKSILFSIEVIIKIRVLINRQTRILSQQSVKHKRE